MDVKAPKTFRIAIYGVGFVGTSLVRKALERGWPIVAAYNRAGSKVGKDVGDLAGVGPIGVIVEDCDTADYSKLDADIAIVAVNAPSQQRVGVGYFPIYERLLDAGVNVAAMGGRLYKPQLAYPAETSHIDALAKERGVTFTGAGLWDMTRIWPGLIVAGPCTRMDEIEYTSLIEPLSQGLWNAPLLGIGLTPEEHDAQIGPKVTFNSVYEGLSAIVLEHYGYTVASVESHQEPVVFDEDIYSTHLQKVLPAGISVGMKMTMKMSSREGLALYSRYEWRILRPGEVEFGKWTVKGSPTLSIEVTRQGIDDGSATSVLNRVPDIVAARPGVVTVMDLGPMSPTLPLTRPSSV